MLGRAIPDNRVFGIPQPDLAHMNRIRKQPGTLLAEPQCLGGHLITGQRA